MNALATLTQGKISLTAEELLIMQEIADDSAAFDMQPARVKIAPGGIGQYLLGDDTAKSFTAIVAISQKIRGYWPGSGTGAAPLCSSPDGATGYFASGDGRQIDDAMKAKKVHPGVDIIAHMGTLPDSFACATCPMNQWASEHQKRGGQGKGKACKEMRRLLLLINGWALPALMSLPPTSIRPWDAYASALAAKRSAYFAVRTKFELDTAEANGGETYNVVRVNVAEPVAGPDLTLVADIRRQYREMVSGLPVVADEYDVPAEADDSVIPF